MKKRGLILFLWLFAGTYTYGQYMPQIKGVSLGDTMEKVVDRLKNMNIKYEIYDDDGIEYDNFIAIDLCFFLYDEPTYGVFDLMDTGFYFKKNQLLCIQSDLTTDGWNDWARRMKRQDSPEVTCIQLSNLAWKIFESIYGKADYVGPYATGMEQDIIWRYANGQIALYRKFKITKQGLFRTKGVFDFGIIAGLK